MPTPTNYRFEWNAATILAAASGACAKVTLIKLRGDTMDDIILETNDAMTAPEIASVKAAVQALTQDLVEDV